MFCTHQVRWRARALDHQQKNKHFFLYGQTSWILPASLCANIERQLLNATQHPALSKHFILIKQNNTRHELKMLWLPMNVQYPGQRSALTLGCLSSAQLYSTLSLPALSLTQRCPGKLASLPDSARSSAQSFFTDSIYMTLSIVMV